MKKKTKIRTMEFTKRVTLIAEEMCDYYCRWPYQWNEDEKGMPLDESAICANCPLNRLMALGDAYED